MAIFITGDTHGDFRRFKNTIFYEQVGLSKSDCVIICGDFGGIWDGNADERYWLDWLEAKPFTTLFVSGNHENFDLLAEYGIVLDKNGKPSHNPDDANNGCQLPMAGHKGYALGLAVEVLAGLFIGAKAGKDAVEGSDGILMFALQPDLFVSESQYRSNLSSLIKEIKNSALAFDSTGIRIPGENSVKQIDLWYKLGICKIPDIVYEDLVALKEKNK